MTIAHTTNKSIYISVEQPKLKLNSFNHRCELIIRVKIDNYSNIYYGSGHSPSFKRAMSSAMTRAITNILRDENIIKYLIKEK